jgi:hypothetical protein
MADYYTPTVVDPMIPLAAMLPIERLFLSQVFDEELTSETAYYCSEDGARDLISLASAEVRAALDAATPETSRLAQKLIDEHPMPSWARTTSTSTCAATSGPTCCRTSCAARPISIT